MIGKIDIDYDSPCRLRQEYGQKINEVIVAVNKLETMAKNTNTVLESLIEENNIHEKQIDELQMKLEPEKCEPQDHFAEQRKWIGCVCRFWYDNPNDTLLDYLDKIQTGKNGVVQYYSKESGDWFPHCEPILPTDDIIYKGGDNE